VPPYTWRLTDEPLPPGLYLHPDGVIAGAIKPYGSIEDWYMVDFEVTDAAGETDETLLGLEIDTLKILEVRHAKFKVNWNLDKWDRDSVALIFTAQLPGGFRGFNTDTEMTVEFGDYFTWSSDEKLFLSQNRLVWKAKEGDARFDEDGDRMDVPITVFRVRAVPERRLLHCKLRVRYDDCIGRDFDVTDSVYNLVTNYGIEVELDTDDGFYIGRSDVRMLYRGNPIIQKGYGRMVR
jgi:hypothetical protein